MGNIGNVFMNGSETGVCFCYDQNYFFTCWHLIPDSAHQGLTILPGLTIDMMCNNTTYRFDKIYYDTALDVMLLHSVEAGNLTAFSTCQNYAIDSPVQMLYINSGAVASSAGQITGINGNNLHCNYHADPGNSGAPVVNANGNIVGMHLSASPGAFHCDSVSVRSDILSSFYSTCRANGNRIASTSLPPKTIT